MSKNRKIDSFFSRAGTSSNSSSVSNVQPTNSGEDLTRNLSENFAENESKD